MTARPHQIPPDPAGECDSSPPLHAASGSDGPSAVFSFRYEHFFHSFPPGYPGVDHARRMVFEPHDQDATHLCALKGGASAPAPGETGYTPAVSAAALSAPGALLAVSTSVPATLRSIPESWPEWFGFALLGPKRLAKTVINTRMVLHPGVRGTDFFARFRLAALAHCREAGYLLALHYCGPAMAARYEALGHRLHHKAFEILPGLVRVPMIYDLRELDACPTRLPVLPKGGALLAAGDSRHNALTPPTTGSGKDGTPCGRPS
jgi:hypothetical protein